MATTLHLTPAAVKPNKTYKGYPWKKNTLKYESKLLNNI